MDGAATEQPVSSPALEGAASLAAAPFVSVVATSEFAGGASPSSAGFVAPGASPSAHAFAHFVVMQLESFVAGALPLQPLVVSDTAHA